MPESRENRNWRVNFSTSARDAVLRAKSEPRVANEAFLVVRQGRQWSDIFKQLPGIRSTLGRDENNHIVVADDRCSRWHCEVFFQQDRWVVRDLDSRNGTKVAGRPVEEDRGLIEGDVIRIGRSEILFTYDISQRLNISDSVDQLTDEIDEEDTEPKILRRSSNCSFLSTGEGGVKPEDGIRVAFANLYELVVQIVSAKNVSELANRVLDGVLPASGSDIGAILLFPPESIDSDDPDELRIASYRAPEKAPYQKVSRRLSKMILQEKQAILALDINKADAEEFQTLQELDAHSVICAPLRDEDRTLGLIHLYTRHGKELDADALDFTLAIADQMAVALTSLNQRQVLAEGLEQAWDQYHDLQLRLEIESDLVGISSGMQKLRETIARVARSDAAVLVRGESGVGKELVARAVHFNSARVKGALVCLNCAALSESLLESELFGHEKGAFTGAIERSVGKFEQAHEGTLFLDEVGEMPLAIQAKFLRALEGHPFERVGGSTAISVDVRVVAATNRNLEEAVKSGEFRSDLFYRLQILELNIPSLRERRDDISLLADHFLTRACERLGRPQMQLSPDAMHRLRIYDWPGNIRELRNVIERSVVLCDGPEIDVDNVQIGQRLVLSTNSGEDLFEPISLEEMERRCIERTLAWTKWKKRESARILGINRSTLDRKLERYGIRPPAEDA